MDDGQPTLQGPERTAPEACVAVASEPPRHLESLPAPKLPAPAVERKASAPAAPVLVVTAQPRVDDAPVESTPATDRQVSEHSNPWTPGTAVPSEATRSPAPTTTEPHPAVERKSSEVSASMTAVAAEPLFPAGAPPVTKLLPTTAPVTPQAPAAAASGADVPSPAAVAALPRQPQTQTRMPTPPPQPKSQGPPSVRTNSEPIGNVPPTDLSMGTSPDLPPCTSSSPESSLHTSPASFSSSQTYAPPRSPGKLWSLVCAAFPPPRLTQRHAAADGHILEYMERSHTHLSQTSDEKIRSGNNTHPSPNVRSPRVTQRRIASTTSEHAAGVQAILDSTMYSMAMGSVSCADVYQQAAGKVNVSPEQAILSSMPQQRGLFELSEIEAGGCILGDPGLRALFPVIYLNAPMSRLGLAGTGLQNSGVQELCCLLETHPSINGLDLSNNVHLTIDAGMALLALVKRNPHIKHLKMENTSISLTLQTRIWDAMGR